MPPIDFDIPTPGVTAGDTAATQVSEALEILKDAANASVTPTDISINADLTFQSNDATNLRSVRFTSQSSALNGVGDVNCTNVVNGDLYFNNASGTPIQITENGVVKVTSGNTVLSFQSVSTNLTILNTDTFIFCDTSTAAARTFTLPSANSVTAGRQYWIADNTGSAASNPITINRAGSDTINGATSYVIRSNYGGVILVSNGSNSWRAMTMYDRSGGINLANNVSIAARNAANSANVNLLSLSASNVLAIGGDCNVTIYNNVGTTAFSSSATTITIGHSGDTETINLACASDMSFTTPTVDVTTTTLTLTGTTTNLRATTLNFKDASNNTLGTWTKTSNYLTLNTSLTNGIRLIANTAASGIEVQAQNGGNGFFLVSSDKLAFYNGTPIAKQTGVAVSAAALHAALTNLGLIT